MGLRFLPEGMMSWRRGRTYSQDLRKRVLSAEGSVREVAGRFGVSPSYVVKVRQRRDCDGSAEPRSQKPPVRRRLVPFHAAIAARVAERPSATIAELREWLRLADGVSASMFTVWKTLRLLGLTLKKSRRATEQTRADIAEGCRAGRELQPRLNARRLVFLDETWAKPT